MKSNRSSNPRKLRHPRLYSVEIQFSATKTVNKMLGVAFNNAQRQRFYLEYQKYRLWGEYNHYSVRFCSELLEFTNAQ